MLTCKTYLHCLFKICIFSKIFACDFYSVYIYMYSIDNVKVTCKFKTLNTVFYRIIARALINFKFGWGRCKNKIILYNKNKFKIFYPGISLRRALYRGPAIFQWIPVNEVNVDMQGSNRPLIPWKILGFNYSLKWLETLQKLCLPFNMPTYPWKK